MHKKGPVRGLFQGSQVIRILYGAFAVPGHAGIAAQYIRGVGAVVLFGVYPDDLIDTFCLHVFCLILVLALLFPALLFLALLLLALLFLTLVVVLALVVVAAVLTVAVLVVLVIRHVSYLPFQWLCFSLAGNAAYFAVFGRASFPVGAVRAIMICSFSGDMLGFTGAIGNF